MLIELEEYQNIIKQKTKFDEQQLKKYTYKLFSLMTVIPSVILSKNTIDKAKKLCENVDIKDISFVALSIETGLILLTRNKKLYNGLRKKGFRQIMLFENFVSDLYNLK